MMYVKHLQLDHVAPRLLNRKQAAAYCGVSVPTFGSVCPVRAIALGKGKKLERYDRLSLDRWIDGLGPTHSSIEKDWLAELGHK